MESSNNYVSTTRFAPMPQLMIGDSELSYLLGANPANDDKKFTITEALHHSHLKSNKESFPRSGITNGCLPALCPKLISSTLYIASDSLTVEGLVFSCAIQRHILQDFSAGRQDQCSKRQVTRRTSFSPLPSASLRMPNHSLRKTGGLSFHQSTARLLLHHTTCDLIYNSPWPPSFESISRRPQTRTRPTRRDGDRSYQGRFQPVDFLDLRTLR